MEEKTFVFPGGTPGGSSSVDPNVLLAMMNNGGNGFGGNGNWMWIIFLFFLYGWGGRGFGNGFGGNGGTDNLINNDYGRQLLMSAVQGNRTAISELASTLSCSVGQIQSAINSVQSSIQNVGAQVGMSGQQVINAIQSGNQNVSAQLADCCCKTQQSILTQGYESRLSTQEQTSVLGSKVDSGTGLITTAIANQTALINDKFCALEMREMQSKIDSLREKNSSLLAQLSNEHQTAQVIAGQQAVYAPLQASLVELGSRLTKIESSLPQTVSVPYPQLQAFNPEIARAAAYGAYAADSAYGLSNTGC